MKKKKGKHPGNIKQEPIRLRKKKKTMTCLEKTENKKIKKKMKKL